MPPNEKPPDAPRLLSRASVVVLRRNESMYPLEGDISLALKLDVGDLAPPIFVGELTDYLRDRFSEAWSWLRLPCDVSKGT